MESNECPVPSLMVKIEFFKSDVVILFVVQDDHILNLLEGVIKTKTYMKKGLNTMSDLKNISFIREGILCSKITESEIPATRNWHLPLLQQFLFYCFFEYSEEFHNN